MTYIYGDIDADIDADTDMEGLYQRPRRRNPTSPSRLRDLRAKPVGIQVVQFNAE